MPTSDSSILTGINPAPNLQFNQERDDRISLPDLDQKPVQVPDFPSVNSQPSQPVDTTSYDYNANLFENMMKDGYNQYPDTPKIAPDVNLAQSQTDRYIGNKYGYDLKRDNEDFYAQNQSGWQEAGNAAANLIGKTVGFVAQNAGYILGAPTTPVEGLSGMTDNFLVKAGDYIHDATSNMFPIYKPLQYTQGNIWNKLGTSQWWADDAIDRVALTAAMFVPGFAETELGIGAFGSTIDNAGQVTATGVGTKFVQGMAEDPANYGKLGEYFTNQLNKAAVGEFALTDPAGMNLKAYTQGLTNSELLAWNIIGQSGLNAKESQSAVFAATGDKDKASKAGMKSFWETVPLTLLGSLYELPQMFSTMRGARNMIEKFGDVFNATTDEEALSAVTATPSPWNTAGKAVLTGIEHGQNESLQVAIGRYNEENAEGKDKRNDVTGILSDFINNINDPNGQNNIALGTIQGLLTTFGGKAVDAIKGTTKAEQEQALSVYNLMQQSKLDRRIWNGDFTQRNDDGTIKTDPATGEILYDQDKIAQAGASLIGAQNLLSARKKAIDDGDSFTLGRLNNNVLSSYAYAFMQIPNGLDNFTNRLKLEAKFQGDRSFNDLNELGDDITPQEQLQKNLDVVNKLKRVYNNIDQMQAGFMKLPFDKKDPNETQRAKVFLDDLKFAQYNESSNQLYLQQEVQNNITRIAALNLPVDVNNIDEEGNPKKFENPGNPDEVGYNALLDYDKGIKQDLQESKDRYRTLIDKDAQRKAFKDNAEDVQSIQEEAQKTTLKQKADKILTQAKSVIDTVKSKITLNKDENQPEQVPVENPAINQFANDIKSGVDRSSPEDQQFYQNNKEDIENKLQDLKSADTGLPSTSKSEEFSQAGERSKRENTPEHLGKWIVSNTKQGDIIKRGNTNFEATNVHTNTKGNTLVQFTPFETNENGKKIYEPKNAKIINDDPSVENGLDGAKNLYHYKYNDADGISTTEKGEYIPVSAETSNEIEPSLDKNGYINPEQSQSINNDQDEIDNEDVIDSPSLQEEKAPVIETSKEQIISSDIEASSKPIGDINVNMPITWYTPSRTSTNDTVDNGNEEQLRDIPYDEMRKDFITNVVSTPDFNDNYKLFIVKDKYNSIYKAPANNENDEDFTPDGEVIVVEKNDGISPTVRDFFGDKKYKDMANMPIVFSFNKKMFFENGLEQRASIFAAKQETTTDEAKDFYNKEQAKSDKARDVVTNNNNDKVQIAVISTSDGVMPKSDSASPTDRFGNSFTIKIQGKDDKSFKKGAVVLQYKGASFAVGTAKLQSNSTELLNIEKTLDKRFDTFDEARNIIEQYLNNIFNTYEDSFFYVEKDEDKFKIVYKKVDDTDKSLTKEQKREAAKESNSIVGQLNFNVNRKALSEGMNIYNADTNSFNNISAEEYNQYIKPKLLTTLKKTVDKDGNLYMKPVNAAFSFSIIDPRFQDNTVKKLDQKHNADKVSQLSENKDLTKEKVEQIKVSLPELVKEDKLTQKDANKINEVLDGNTVEDKTVAELKKDRKGQSTTNINEVIGNTESINNNYNISVNGKNYSFENGAIKTNIGTSSRKLIVSKADENYKSILDKLTETYPFTKYENGTISGFAKTELEGKDGGKFTVYGLPAEKADEIFTDNNDKVVKNIMEGDVSISPISEVKEELSDEGKNKLEEFLKRNC